MDPLHQTDSAISVTFKDDESHHGPSMSPQPPPSKKLKTAADNDPRQVTPAGPCHESPPVTQTPATDMENLIPPLDHVASPGTHPSPSSLIPSQPPLPTSPTDTAGSRPSPEAESAHPYSVQDQPPSAADTAREQDEDNLDAVFQATHGPITVDHDELESDAGYESDRASFASTSLSSSARDYLYENGRRYHRFREGRYNFPNDEAEQDREDMKHACVKMLCQKLHFAPIDERTVQNILDIGTGTGIWAIEMGDLFPSANVLGIDLSPIQPDWVPSNVHFVVDDAESEWLYPENHFDYIHSRHTVMAIKDWPRLYRQART